MAKSFAGFSPKALTFLRQLEKNNSRDWFQPRKAEFESLLRDPMLELVERILTGLRSFAVDYVVEPKKAMLRIYRDVRFAKDKSPYKTQIAAIFPRAGLGKTTGGCLYVGISPKGVEIAGGVYMPGPPELAALRHAIDDNPKPFKAAIENKSLLKLMGHCQGEKMFRVPKGYAPDHSEAELLRRKQFFYFVMLEPNAAVQPGLDLVILKHFKALVPVVEYLNQIMLKSAAELAGDDRPRRPKHMF